MAHRARQDQHASVADHEGSSAATISIDYGFLSRSGESDRNKLTVLFAHDRHSKAVCAIPTPRKGGQAALSFMTTELSRFILWLGYPEIRLRSDNENSVVAVVDSVRKVLRNLGVEVHKDSVPIDAHQANGPVEQALQSVRQLACTLMSQLEVGLGADPGRVLFDTNHPMWQWAICHAAWIKSRFAVTQGSTAYERLTGCLYRGKVCKFGEAVSHGVFETIPEGSSQVAESSVARKDSRQRCQHPRRSRRCVRVSLSEAIQRLLGSEAFS